MSPRLIPLSRCRRTLAIAGATMLAAGLAAVVSVPSAQAASASATKYARAVPVCGAAKAGHMTCNAMRLVRATKGTPGARAMLADATPNLAAGPAGGYTPNDIATAYGVSPSTATTVTVGIVDAFGDPTILADLNAFDTNYGLPTETATSFKKFDQNGTTTFPATNSGWATEQALDVEAVRGLCHACHIVLIEATDSSDANLAAAENQAVTKGATVVSNSFGGPESGGAPSPTFTAAFNHTGVVQVASTGDHGWYDWDGFNESTASSNSPALPASLPNVVAVGGTSLVLSDTGARADETVWNDNGPTDIYGNLLSKSLGASGGGCSTLELAQPWQVAASGYSNTGCVNGSVHARMTGDIAAVADPFTGFDILDTTGVGDWITIGGTSLAAPVIAALWALAGGPGGVPHPVLSLYAHYKGDTTKPFFDVITGGNGLCGSSTLAACASQTGGSANTLGAGLEDCYWTGTTTTVAAHNGQCHAKTGYDGPSGIGTPKSLNLFKADHPTAKISAPGTVTHGITKTFSGATSIDPFPGGALHYTWTWGDGSAAVTTTSSSVTHKYAKAGKFTIHLFVTDSYYGAKSTTVALTITVK